MEINGRIAAETGKGMLVLLCAVKGDTDRDLDYVAKKSAALRVFADEQGKMNLSVRDIRGELLVVSQFTLAASVRKGNRPSFENAEQPERARRLYEAFVRKLRDEGLTVATGEFGALMAVTFTNDGPVTVMIDSRERSEADGSETDRENIRK